MSTAQSFRVLNSPTPLRGTFRVAGETLASYLALVLASLAVGRSTLRGLAIGENINVTVAALRALGAALEPAGDGNWLVDGVGIGGLRDPAVILDLGRSGLSAQLLLGLVATHPITTVFSGDAVVGDHALAALVPLLREIGARFIHPPGRVMPLTVLGAGLPLPSESILTASDRPARLAMLLAALNVPGRSSVIAPVSMGDHEEWLLNFFGVTTDREDLADGSRRTDVFGQPELLPQDLDLPGDLGNAVFPLIAAITAKDADVTLTHVGYDAEAVALIELLRGMGADIAVSEPRGGQTQISVDLTIRSAPLTGLVVPHVLAARLGKYAPVAAIAAAGANGGTVLPDWQTDPALRDIVAGGLAQIGAKAVVEGASLVIEGTAGARLPGGARIDARLDHRTAMAFLALGLGTDEPIIVADGGLVELNCPGFREIVAALGATLVADVQ